MKRQTYKAWLTLLGLLRQQTATRQAKRSAAQVVTEAKTGLGGVWGGSGNRLPISTEEILACGSEWESGSPSTGSSIAGGQLLTSTECSRVVEEIL